MLCDLCKKVEAVKVLCVNCQEGINRLHFVCKALSEDRSKRPQNIDYVRSVAAS